MAAPEKTTTTDGDDVTYRATTESNELMLTDDAFAITNAVANLVDAIKELTRAVQKLKNG